MDKKELLEKLNTEKKTLEQELTVLAKRADEVERRTGQYGNKEDDAGEVTEMEKRFAIEEQLKKNLEAVNRAIKKFETGEYGLCEKCGNKIEPARLEAIPQASLCLRCKAALAKDGRGKIFR